MHRVSKEINEKLRESSKEKMRVRNSHTQEPDSNQKCLFTRSFRVVGGDLQCGSVFPNSQIFPNNGREEKLQKGSMRTGICVHFVLCCVPMQVLNQYMLNEC